jgi:gamma-glutamylcyclotransferase (GGCT)/AIG2-like uncharacterized protein YtfP
VLHAEAGCHDKVTYSYDRSHLLFVYGTLRSGEEAAFKMEGAQLLGECLTSPRYRLVQKPSFLGLVDGDESVPGELYAVSPEKLMELDEWEDNIFRRSSITLRDGRIADCYKLQDKLIQDVARLKSSQT